MRHLLSFTLTPLFFAFASATAQQGFEFLPDGGRETLLDLIKAGVIEQNTLDRSLSEEEWSSSLRGAAEGLSDEAVETLASYLAINAPIPASGPLPADGKDLAIANCQFCHSFFTGYLVHERDTEGWRAIFKSPFHRELPMTATERETFARYSAINMPVPYEDVPDELRF